MDWWRYSTHRSRIVGRLCQTPIVAWRFTETPYKSEDHARFLIDAFGRGNVFVELQRHFIRGEERTNRELIDIARAYRLPLLATNAAQYAKPYGREVLDVFTCIRESHASRCRRQIAGAKCRAPFEKPAQMREFFADLPEAIENTVRLAERLDFRWKISATNFPRYPVPVGRHDGFLVAQ